MDRDVTFVKGVGEAVAEKFTKLRVKCDCKIYFGPSAVYLLRKA